MFSFSVPFTHKMLLSVVSRTNFVEQKRVTKLHIQTDVLVGNSTAIITVKCVILLHVIAFILVQLDPLSTSNMRWKPNINWDWKIKKLFHGISQLRKFKDASKWTKLNASERKWERKINFLEKFFFDLKDTRMRLLLHTKIKGMRDRKKLV